MPIFAYKWLGVGLALIALAVGSYFKGKHTVQVEWDVEKSLAVAEKAKEEARLLKEKSDLVEKHDKKEKEDAKTIADLTTANRGLFNTVAGFRRSTSLAVPSSSYCEAGKLLESCAGLLKEVAIRGTERLGTCLEENSTMAGIAESERGKAELSNSLYNSIRSRKRSSP